MRGFESPSLRHGAFWCIWADDEGAMAARGVHFAITSEERDSLVACEGDEARIDFVKSVIEPRWDKSYLCETDKAWDAIHRSLGDFPPDTPEFYKSSFKDTPYALPEAHGSYPLKFCVLGGKRLIENEEWYFIRLIEPSEVVDIAVALNPIDRDWLHQKYFHHCKGAWPEYGEDDFAYTWEWFAYLREFFKRMAGNGRPVIFTADH